MRSCRLRCLLTFVLVLPWGPWLPAFAEDVAFELTYIDDAEGDFEHRRWLDADSAFQRNLRAGVATWSAWIESSAVLRVRVEATRGLARAGGTFTNAALLFTTPEGVRIFEPGPVSVIRAGDNPGGPPDILLFFNVAFVEQRYWFDPTPWDREDEVAPSGVTDFVSIAAHELGHALGMAGTRAFLAGPDYGTLPGFANPVDALSRFKGSGAPLDAEGLPNPLVFLGEQALEVFGQPVPLSHVGPGQRLHSQDFYHLGSCGDAPILTESLMNGCSVPTNGTRLQLTALDRAVLADLGYPVRSSPSQPGPCGDIDGNGVVTSGDVALLRAARAKPTGEPLLEGGLDRCTARVPPVPDAFPCDAVDAAILMRHIADLAPRVTHGCREFAPQT